MSSNDSPATELEYDLDKTFWFKQYLFKSKHILTKINILQIQVQDI